jgi:hypothetical protein
VQLRLVYASNSMEDVLLKLHLDAMAAGYYGKFKVLLHAAHTACCAHCFDTWNQERFITGMQRLHDLLPFTSFPTSGAVLRFHCSWGAY